MNLTSLYLNNFVAPSASSDFASNGQGKSKETNFDSFLKKADGSEYQKKNDISNDKRYENKSEGADESKQKQNVERSEQKKKNAANEKKDDKNLKNEKAQKTEKPEKAEKAEKTEKTEDLKNSDVNKEIVEKIAKELNMSVEDINKILESLNLTAAELTDQSNLLSFMEKAMDVDNAIDLLSIDGVKDIMKNIKDIVNEYSEFTRVIDMKKTDIKEMPAEITEETEKTEVPRENTVISENTEAFNAAVDKNISENREIKRELVQENNNNSIENENSLQQNTSYSIESSMASNQMTNSNQENGSKEFDMLQNIQIDTNAANDVTDNVNKMFGEALNKATNGRDVNSAEVIKQIVENFKVNSTDTVDEIKIMLKPDYLGNVTIKVATESGIVTANILAENEKVKGIIEENINQLREVLETQGIQVSEINVNVGTEQSDNARNLFEFGQEKSSKRISDILNGFEEEISEAAENIVTEKDVLNNEVNFTA